MLYCEKRAFVLDLETTINAPGDFAADPFFPTNRIVMGGWGWEKGKDGDWGIGDGVLDCVDTGTNAHSTNDWDILVNLKEDFREQGCLLVGQNIKFDLLYVMRYDKRVTPKEITRINIWDIQIAEYIITAHRSKMASLDDMSLKYGGTPKNPKIAEYWEKKVPTELIPTAELSEYLEGDITNTFTVFNEQRKYLLSLGKRGEQLDNLIKQMCAALGSVIIAEHEGMEVDYTYLNDQYSACDKKLAELQSRWDKEVKVNSATGMPFNPASPKDMSLLFFGGVIEVKEKELVGTYKNGNDKYKTVINKKNLVGLTDPRSAKAKPSGRASSGLYSVNDETLTTIIDNDGLASAPVAKLLQDIRFYSKVKETYYGGLLAAVKADGKIHANIHQTLTKTGRLSCSKPNLQNQTEVAGIKGAFVSRYIDGRIIDIDFKQLEVVGLALLSKDIQLTEDLNNGTDIHSVLYESMYGRVPSSSERKGFKPLTFGLIYGASAKTLAANAGISLSEAKTFIKTFYGRYPGVATYHEQMHKLAIENRIVTAAHDPGSGLPVGLYLHTLPTGRMLAFTEYFNEYTKDMGFSSTELKNWPIQSFATADIVPVAMHYIVKRVYEELQNTHFIATVHDSLVFDTENPQAFSDFLDRHEDFAMMAFREAFGYNPSVQLEWEVSINKSWGTRELI